MMYTMSTIQMFVYTCTYQYNIHIYVCMYIHIYMYISLMMTMPFTKEYSLVEVSCTMAANKSSVIHICTASMLFERIMLTVRDQRP